MDPPPAPCGSARPARLCRRESPPAPRPPPPWRPPTAPAPSANASPASPATTRSAAAAGSAAPVPTPHYPPFPFGRPPLVELAGRLAEPGVTPLHPPRKDK